MQPTDVDDNTFDVIVNHCDGLPNVLNPAHLDVTAEGWGKQFAASGGASLVLAINLCAPFALKLRDEVVCLGLTLLATVQVALGRFSDSGGIGQGSKSGVDKGGDSCGVRAVQAGAGTFVRSRP